MTSANKNAEVGGLGVLNADSSQRKEPASNSRTKSTTQAARKLQRETFRTSRLLDFCSERELTKQIGHSSSQWPLVVLKELTDNAIDTCEEAGTAPTIRIEVDNGNITITDNGPGLAADTVKDIIDFSVRVSSREAYVSPTRGAQGNALKTIVAMPFALDGVTGETKVESREIEHHITFKVDHVRQEPRIAHVVEASNVKTGTRITVKWPVCACSKLDDARPHFLQMAEDYGWLNPHLTLSVAWAGIRCVDYVASDPAWKKWRPCDPTPPHWYDEARLQRLMGAYIGRDEDCGRVPRTVRDFISDFRGLSGSAKQKLVLDDVAAARLSLPQFFGSDQVNANGIAKLLDSMQRHTKPVKPADLGFIGKDHLAARFTANGVDARTFKYQRAAGETEGLPDVIETAFGWCPKGDRRRIITGVNWSVAIGNPFRDLGATGEGLDSLLAEQRCGRNEPAIFVLHLARPRITYTDHGKTAVAIPGGGQ